MGIYIVLSWLCRSQQMLIENVTSKEINCFMNTAVANLRTSEYYVVHIFFTIIITRSKRWRHRFALCSSSFVLFVRV